MGACVSSEDRDASAKNANIDKNLKKDKSAMRQEVKLLLLGMLM